MTGPGPCRQPREPSDVVEVTVTEDHSLDSEQVDPETVGIDHHRVGRKAGVEQERRRGHVASHGDQRGETVLGPETHRRLATLELRCLGEAHAEGHAGGPLITRQQRVVHVVDQGGHDHLVDGFQTDRVDRITQSRSGRNECRIQSCTAGSLTHARTFPPNSAKALPESGQQQLSHTKAWAPHRRDPASFRRV